MAFRDVVVGDTVDRLLAGAIPMRLKVTAITESRIICGEWEFDRNNGLELDDFIPITVSHLVNPHQYPSDLAAKITVDL